jgi:predicted metal-dependent peptidase
MKATNVAAERKLRKARAIVIQSNYFFGSLLIRQEIVEDSRVKVMATNGKQLFYNPAWVERTPLDEVQGVSVHEVLHVALNHHSRRGNRDPEEWNEAADYAINPIVLEAGFVLPDDRLFREDFVGKNAEEIFKILRAECQQQEDEPEQEPEPDDDEQDDSDDTSQSDSESESDEGDSAVDGDEDGEGDQSESDDAEGEGDGESPYGADCGGCGSFMDPPSVDEGDISQEVSDWQVALSQAERIASMAGQMPGMLKRAVDEALAPRADWRELLRRFFDQNAKQDYSWQEPNRRYIAQGLYLPSMRSKEIGPVLYVIDASGSMPMRSYAEATAEVQAIVDELQPEFVDVVVHDAVICEHRRFLPGEDIRMDVVAGGGTWFKPVLDWIEESAEQYACIVWFTDLEPFDWHACKPPSAPLVWIDYTGGRAFPPPFGDEVVTL